mgnify:FL=1
MKKETPYYTKAQEFSIYVLVVTISFVVAVVVITYVDNYQYFNA